jgi:hypothetical protein
MFSPQYLEMGGNILMTRNLLATCILSLAFAGVANAQGTATSTETGAHYTQAQLKQLASNAHAPEQYRALASYFGKQHKDYLQQATEEKKEWERRSRNVTGILAKYPRPVDSARNLYEYYMYKATEAQTLESKYERLAAPNAPVSAE